MRTTVVNIRRSDYDVYCGRGGIWGNPFIIGPDGNRDEVIAKHRLWLPTQPGLMALLRTLKGKRLGCFCAPLSCHCDTLAEFADAIPDPPVAPPPAPVAPPPAPAPPPPAPKPVAPARRVIDLSSGHKLDIRNF